MVTSSTSRTPTDRTRLRRKPQRGAYDLEAVTAILDAAPFCHVGFVVDEQPYVIPTIHGRLDDVLYFHGATSSRMLRHLGSGVPVCVTASILDGMVLARSAFNSSMNYRSAVVLGNARPVTEADEKERALRAVTEHVLPGRWDALRPPTPTELKSTSVLALPIDEASAKVRTGPADDPPEEFSLDVWAGVLPVTTMIGTPEPDPDLREDIEVPEHISRAIGRSRT